MSQRDLLLVPPTLKEPKEVNSVCPSLKKIIRLEENYTEQQLLGLRDQLS